MCSCGDLKYARKNHTHKYITQAALDAAVAGVQAQIDALTTDVDTLTAALDALTTTHTTDTADLQAQIDALQAALDECCGCTGWAEEFDTGLGSAVVDDPSDWSLSYSASAERLRTIRDGGAEFPIGWTVLTVPSVTYRAGMTLDCSTRNDSNISQTTFQVYTQGGAFPTVYTDTSPSGSNHVVSIDLSPYLSPGDVITSIKFGPTAADGYATTFARWYLDYVRLVCPA